MEIVPPRDGIGAGPSTLAHARAAAENWAAYSKVCAYRAEAAAGRLNEKARPGYGRALFVTDCDAAALWSAALRCQANEMSWFFSGIERIRLPVAAKNALSTAGAATKIVGSPTPPQKPPDGMTIASTFGIS